MLRPDPADWPPLIESNEEDKKKALAIYRKKGAKRAADEVGVSIRTVQRWAKEAGVKSGYRAEPMVECPSAAAYKRGCRCDGCVLANREVNRLVKARRIKRKKKGVTPVPHGVGGYSNYDCRCGACRTAWTAYLRERREVRAEAAAKQRP